MNSWHTQAMRKIACLFAVIAGVAGCGGNDSSNDSGGGAPGTGGGGSGGSGGSGGDQSIGGSGGSAGTGAGGGDPTALRGAIAIDILSPDGCSLGEQFQDFPELGSGRPVTASDKVQLLEDQGADSDQSVACTWQTLPIGDYVSATILLGASGSESRLVSWGALLADGQVNTFNLVLESPPGVPTQYAANTCTGSVIELDSTTRSAWVSFSCDPLTDAESTDLCAVGPSYFALENCALPE
jgi:hypothetical protein